jgi:beta-glucosidase
MDSVYYSEGMKVGYRFFDGMDKEPLFPFGYGLSYTTFNYAELQIINNLNESEEIVKISFNINNSGEREGDEIVQLYMQNPSDDFKVLKKFARINLNPGETKSVHFNLEKDDVSHFDIKSKNWKVGKGNYTIFIGRSSQDIRLKSDVFID